MSLFNRTTVFCLEARYSKHEMIRYDEGFGDIAPWLRFCCIRTLRRKTTKQMQASRCVWKQNRSKANKIKVNCARWRL